MKETGHISIEQINAKDDVAFQTLYAHYYKILVLYAMQIVESQEAAEDVVQEVFANVWEKEDPFLSELSFISYLYNSIRNASINYLRHKHVEDEYIQKILHDYNEYPTNEENDDFFDAEVYRLLFQLIESLPARCREVMTKAMEGKKNEEIAQALNISVTTVKTYKKRSLQMLKKNLPAKEFIFIYMLLHL